MFSILINNHFIFIFGQYNQFILYYSLNLKHHLKYDELFFWDKNDELFEK